MSEGARGSGREARPVGILVAATILLVLLGGAFTLGTRYGDSAGRSLIPLPSGPMEAGAYVVDGELPVRIAFEVPDGWSKALSDSNLVVIERRPAGQAERPHRGVKLGFSVVDNLFADPCALDGPMLEPRVGPSVEDLAEAFAGIPVYQASAPAPVSVDGHPGLKVELDVLLYMCPASEAELWRTSAGSIRVAAGEEELLTLWVLDVDGERIVITGSSFPETAADDIEALRAVFGTIDLTAGGE